MIQAEWALKLRTNNTGRTLSSRLSNYLHGESITTEVEVADMMEVVGMEVVEVVEAVEAEGVEKEEMVIVVEVEEVAEGGEEVAEADEEVIGVQKAVYGTSEQPLERPPPAPP